MRFATNAIATVALGLLTINESDAFSTLLQKTFGLKKKFNDFKVKADKAKSLFQLLKSKGDPIMFPDVHLPKSMSIGERIDNILQNQISTNIEIVTYILEGEIEQSLDIDLDDVLPGALEGLDSTLDTPSLYGMPKPSKGKEWPRSSQIRGVYPTMINRLIKVEMDDADPAEGYFYFGNGNYLEILPKMLQSNPFWASALSVSGDNDEYIELTTDDKTSKYSIILDTMQEKVQSRFVNVRFNRDMTINQITNKGEVVPEEDWNYYASAACYNVYFYSQQVHALIHVLHYLMCAGITLSTEESHDASIEAWGAIYDDNIAIKYYEVAGLLFESNFGNNDNKVLTGKDGIGGTVEVMAPLRELLCLWGSFKTADDFMKKFLLKDIYDTAKNPEDLIDSSNILTEFRKQVDLVEPYATELTEAMKADNPDGLKDAEDFLTKFMSDTGEGVSSIDSISSWVQLMSCTGIMHGSTLSYSRMTLIPEIWRWIDISTDTFSDSEIDIMSPIIATIQGMCVDRHVFTSEVTHGTKWDTSNISPRLKAVMEKYNQKSEDLKTLLKDELLTRPDFNEYGWILTDQCPDGFDGKQLTIATYI